MNQILRHLDNLEDCGCGSDRIKVVEAWAVGFGVALRDEAYDGFVWGSFGNEMFAFLPAYRQWCHRARVRNGVSNRQDGNYIRQFEFVAVVLRRTGLALQIVLNFAEVLAGKFNRPYSVGYEFFKLIRHFQLISPNQIRVYPIGTQKAKVAPVSFRYVGLPAVQI